MDGVLVTAAGRQRDQVEVMDHHGARVRLLALNHNSHTSDPIKPGALRHRRNRRWGASSSAPGRRNGPCTRPAAALQSALIIKLSSAPACCQTWSNRLRPAAGACIREEQEQVNYSCTCGNTRRLEAASGAGRLLPLSTHGASLTLHPWRLSMMCEPQRCCCKSEPLLRQAAQRPEL